MTPTQHRTVRTFAWQAVTVFSAAYLGLLSSLAVWAVVPFLMGWIPTVVISGSMEPLIMTGDIIAAQRVTLGEIAAGIVKPGQVLLAENPVKPGSLITHRVVVVRADGKFTTKGDANKTIDPVPTPAANIQGIERFRVPYLGLPVLALKDGNPAPMAAFVALTLAALTVSSRDAKRSRQERLKGRRRASGPSRRHSSRSRGGAHVRMTGSPVLVPADVD